MEATCFRTLATVASRAYQIRRLVDAEYRAAVRDGRQHACDRFGLCTRIENWRWRGWITTGRAPH